MIIEIEGYNTEIFLTGRKCSESKLCWQINKAFAHMENHENFVPVLCRLFQYDPISCQEDIEPDFVVDIDTHKVYVPDHKE